MKLKVRIVILTIILAITVGGNTTVIKASGMNYEGTQYLAKTAFVPNVRRDGTNLNNETIDGELSKEIEDTSLEIIQYRNGTIDVLAQINNKHSIITLSPKGKSDDNSTIFFDGKACDDFSLVYAAYEDSPVNCYFTEFTKRCDGSKSVLKIYLKESGTRDYLLFEVFGFNLNYKTGILENVSANNLLAAWGVAEFQPVIQNVIELPFEKEPPSTRAYTDSKKIKYSETFYWLGETNYHEMVIQYLLDYMYVPIGGEAAQINRIKVFSKKCTYSINHQFNSNTESALHVKGAELVQTAIPGTAWRGTGISGVVHPIGNLSAFLGKLSVKVGPLSISINLNALLTFKSFVQINQTYSGYENTFGRFTKACSTKMDSRFMLTQVGQYFDVVSYLRDYGNQATGWDYYKCMWLVTIVNGVKLTTRTHDVYFTEQIRVR